MLTVTIPVITITVNVTMSPCIYLSVDYEEGDKLLKKEGDKH